MGTSRPLALALHRLPSWRTLLAATVAVILLAQAGFLALTLRSDYRSALEMAGTATGHVTHLVGQQMGNTLDAADLTLQRALDVLDGRNLATAASDPDLLERLTAMAAQMPHLGTIAVFDARGEYVISTTPGGGGRGPVVQRHYWLRHAAGEAGPLVGEVVTGALTGLPVFTVSRAIQGPKGRFNGVVVASIRLEHFTDFVRTADRSPTGGVTIYDRDGTMLLREPLLPDQIGRSFGHLALFDDSHRRMGSGTFEATSPFDGVRRIVSFRFLDRWPLVVVATTSRADALRPWGAEASQMSALLAGEVTLLLVLTLLTVRSMRREEEARHQADSNAADLVKALADKDMLLREIHHRVKNNLQMVVNLLHMEATSAAPQTRAAFEDSIARIDAMSVVHELIYSSGDFSSIDSRPYLEKLCRTLMLQAPNIHVELDAAAITLTTDQALSLAVVVNEAVCNAVKHAFPPDAPGTIRLRLTDSDPAILEIADNGVGLPVNFDPARTRSLGTRLITTLARQLGTGATFESDNGTCVRLTIRRAV